MKKSANEWGDNNYLLQRYAAVLSLGTIAQASGLSESTVSRRLRLIDPQYSALSRRWAIERKRAFLLYLKCHSLRQTARQSGVNHATLWHWFRSMHPEYSLIARSGIFASSSDWLNGRKAKRQPERAREVEQWLLNKLPELMRSEGQAITESNRSSFTIRKESSLRRRELPLIESQVAASRG